MHQLSCISAPILFKSVKKQTIVMDVAIVRIGLNDFGKLERIAADPTRDFGVH